MRDLKSLFPTFEQIPNEYRIETPLHQREVLLNGKLEPWNGDSLDVLSPVRTLEADGSLKPVLVGSYPQGGVPEALKAMEAAVAAWDMGAGRWPTMAVPDRIACLEDFLRRMAQKRAEIVRLLMWEIGKSLADSEKEFDRTTAYISDTIDEMKDMDREGSRFQVVEGIIAQVRRAPLGVVLCMGPFNYPLNETFCMLIPALLMGNTIVFKTPKHGSLLHYPLLECFAASFPAGVINTVYGKGAEVVPAMLQTGKVNVLALIGSSRVASDLKKMAPKANRLRAVLGLDAKNAAIILPDANLEEAVKECVLGTLSYNGQRCTALKILFVHRSIADAFLEKLSAAVSNLKPGMPWTEKVNLTPLPEPGKPGYLAEVTEDALSKGAKIINEGGGQTEGSFVFPAILYPVAKGMRCYREEQFGPLVPVVPFDDMQEAIQYLEESDHGQQVSIFGQNAKQMGHLADALVNQVCRVNLNVQCQRGPDVFPFTGRKDSAEGTLSVQDALRSFSIRTMVATKATESNKKLLNQIIEEKDSTFVSTRFLL